jgi:uncharacterized protein YecE (DUF72 family)
MGFDREQHKAALGACAEQGIYLGTSSWKYAGWRGQLYDEARYVYHGRLAESRFERNCLAEYAEVFKTVSVDAAYYQFPSQRFLEGMMGQVPADFKFAFKVTDTITLKRYPNLPRFGLRAGEANEDFLNADLFASSFLGPCEPFRASIGLLMFEFTRFQGRDFTRGREFVEALDGFLSRLPQGWPYGVEIRNPTFLQPEYFSALARHNVVHVFNSWEAMPSIQEQSAMPGSLTHPELVAARLLLRPGRKYADAVKQFSPYDRVQDPYPEGRAAGAGLVRAARARKSKVYIFVNNRFEGNALETIAAIVDALQQPEAA